MTGKAPTIEQEMSKFKGFSTNNGETVDPKDTVKGPGDDSLSAEERAAGITVIDEKPGAAAPKEVKPELTDAEKEAALEKARTTLGLNDDEELTDAEQKAALAEALKDKTKSTGKGKSRDQDPAVRRANGRARAEAARARALEATNRSLEARLAALEAKGGTLTPQGDAAKGDDDKEPDPSKFELGELDPKYIRALARWEVRQELADKSKSEQTKRLSSAQEQAAAEIAEKRAAFEEAGNERFDDFQEVVLDTVALPKTDPAAWPLSATIGQLILQSEFGPEVAYALASDPKEAKRVDKLSDAEKQRWFFRQEAKFEAEKSAASDASGEHEEADSGRAAPQEKPAQRTGTQAPPPPRRRNNGAGSTSQVTPATTDFAAFEAMARGQATRRR